MNKSGLLRKEVVGKSFLIYAKNPAFSAFAGCFIPSKRIKNDTDGLFIMQASVRNTNCRETRISKKIQLRYNFCAAISQP